MHFSLWGEAKLDAMVRPALVEPDRDQRASAARRFDELDAYRGLAALAIVVFHTYQFTREGTQAPQYLYEGTALHHLFGNLEAGVAWFFALSGFLLFGPIATAAIRQSAPFGTRGFLIRRAIRILPLYYVAIISVWLYRFSGGREQWLDLVRHLTFTHSFDSEHLFWTIGPAWSLAIEVHFYLVLALTAPLLYWLCGLLATERARVLLLSSWVAVFGLTGVVYKYWAAFVADIPVSRSAAYFSLPAKLDEFAVGMALGVAAAAYGNRRMVGSAGAWVLRIGGVAALAALFSTRHVDTVRGPLTMQELYFQVLSALAFGLLVAAVVFGPSTSIWTSVLVRPFVLYVGLVSYGIYLWHEPILIELGKRAVWLDPAPDSFRSNAILLVGLSIAAGGASYALIERPAMRLRSLFTADGRLKRSASSSAVAPVVTEYPLPAAAFVLQPIAAADPPVRSDHTKQTPVVPAAWP